MEAPSTVKIRLTTSNLCRKEEKDACNLSLLKSVIFAVDFSKRKNFHKKLKIEIFARQPRSEKKFHHQREIFCIELSSEASMKSPRGAINIGKEDFEIAP